MSESTSQATCDAAAYAVEYLGATGVQLVPTDKDLMVQYLLRKPRGEPLPTDLVLDGRYAYAEHPEKLGGSPTASFHRGAVVDLPPFLDLSGRAHLRLLSLAVSKLGEDIEGAWYLFSPRERRHAGGMKANRETGDGAGYWKAMGKEKRILADGTEVVGTKRELWYYEHIFEEDDMGMRKPVWTRYNATKWRMMEFVASNTNRPRGDDTAPDPMLVGDPILPNHGVLRTIDWSPTCLCLVLRRAVERLRAVQDYKEAAEGEEEYGSCSCPGRRRGGQRRRLQREGGTDI